MVKYKICTTQKLFRFEWKLQLHIFTSRQNFWTTQVDGTKVCRPQWFVGLGFLGLPATSVWFENKSLLFTVYILININIYPAHTEVRHQVWVKMYHKNYFHCLQSWFHRSLKLKKINQNSIFWIMRPWILFCRT